MSLLHQWSLQSCGLLCKSTYTKNRSQQITCCSPSAQWVQKKNSSGLNLLTFATISSVAFAALWPLVKVGLHHKQLTTDELLLTKCTVSPQEDLQWLEPVVLCYSSISGLCSLVAFGESGPTPKTDENKLPAHHQVHSGSRRIPAVA